MQALTGLSYVRPGSDLDLLIHPRSLAELQAALLLLRRHADALPLDGEIVFPDGGAVAWREFAGAGATETVLVKASGAVRLVARTELLAMLGPVC
jgi:phosphoribosyl-dephospho-CoA transferase